MPRLRHTIDSMDRIKCCGQGLKGRVKVLEGVNANHNHIKAYKSNNNPNLTLRPTGTLTVPPVCGYAALNVALHTNEKKKNTI